MVLLQKVEHPGGWLAGSLSLGTGIRILVAVSYVMNVECNQFDFLPASPV
jgi:hypothetical protein